MDDKQDQSIAGIIENGAYYEEARAWYAELFHMPIAERSYFLVVILLALVNMYFAIDSFVGIFPIRQRVPFITSSNNIWEEFPAINRIEADKGADKNVALMRFLVNTYIENREAYDLRLYEPRYRSVWNDSTPSVFEQYKARMDAANVYSPYHLYTNRARRVINVDVTSVEQTAEGLQAHVVFEAKVITLADNQEQSHSKWQADITFKYTNFSIDQSLDKHHWIAHLFGLTGDAPKVSGERRQVVPMTFKVSDYQVKELLE